MMSLEAIYYLAEEQAQKAAAENRVPFVPWNQDEITSWPPFPFPNIGNYRPEGWELLESVRVNKLGDDDGRSYGVDGLKRWCSGTVSANQGKSVGFAIIEEGQFQLYVGAFIKN
jgi:hypothetical protein